MVNDIKQCIVNTLLQVYPGVTVYDEDIPQNFKVPSFLITLTDHNHSKRIADKFNGVVSFDISFFSSKEKNEIKSDCLNIQQELFRGFNLIGTYRVLNKNATIVDNVLHFTFKIRYSEMFREYNMKIKKLELNTRVKE